MPVVQKGALPPKLLTPYMANFYRLLVAVGVVGILVGSCGLAVLLDAESKQYWYACRLRTPCARKISLTLSDALSLALRASLVLQVLKHPVCLALDDHHGDEPDGHQHLPERRHHGPHPELSEASSSQGRPDTQSQQKDEMKT